MYYIVLILLVLPRGKLTSVVGTALAIVDFGIKPLSAYTCLSQLPLRDLKPNMRGGILNKNMTLNRLFKAPLPNQNSIIFPKNWFYRLVL